MPDETAVPCPECNCPLPDYSGYPDFMTPIKMPGTPHYASCPTLPHLSAEDERRLRERLDDLHRHRARALAEARNYVIY